MLSHFVKKLLSLHPNTRPTPALCHTPWHPAATRCVASPLLIDKSHNLPCCGLSSSSLLLYGRDRYMCPRLSCLWAAGSCFERNIRWSPQNLSYGPFSSVSASQRLPFTLTEAARSLNTPQSHILSFIILPCRRMQKDIFFIFEGEQLRILLIFLLRRTRCCHLLYSV